MNLFSGMKRSCDKAPEGWKCARADAHEGPCAAAPDFLSETSEHYYPAPSYAAGGLVVGSAIPAQGHDWRLSPKLGGEICAECAAVKGSRRGDLACGLVQKGEFVTGSLTVKIGADGLAHGFGITACDPIQGRIDPALIERLWDENYMQPSAFAHALLKAAGVR